MVTLIINLFANTLGVLGYDININKNKNTGIIYAQFHVFIRVHKIFLDFVELLDLGDFKVKEEDNDYMIIKIMRETYFWSEIKDTLDFLFDSKEFIVNKLKVLEILNNILDQKELIYQLSDPANYNQVLSKLKEG